MRITLDKAALALALLIAMSAEAQAPTVERLNSGNISVSVKHADIAEVFEMLSLQGRTNILLTSGIEGTVSANLYDVGLDEAVRMIANAGGLAVEQVGDAYYVVPRDDAGTHHASGFTDIRSFKVQYSDTKKVSDIITTHLSRYGKLTVLDDRNMVVVEDKPDFVERIQRLMVQIDRQPTQILIEARILEVQLDSTDTYGIDWAKFFSIGDGTGEIGITGLDTGSPGLFFSVVNSNFRAALNALTAQGRVRTVSTPTLLGLEHEEAEVIIGDRLGYRVTTTINQVTNETIEFLESGVILRVTPFVDHSGRVMMEIHPEVSTGTITADGVPNQTTTEVTTQLLADNGQTVFIGGLLRNTVNLRNEGIPIIKDIPLLGRAFRNDSDVVTRTETIVLITPRIIAPGESVAHTEQTQRVGKVASDVQRTVDAVEWPVTEARPNLGNEPQFNPRYLEAIRDEADESVVPYLPPQSEPQSSVQPRTTTPVDESEALAWSRRGWTDPSPVESCEKRGPAFIPSSNCARAPTAPDLTPGPKLTATVPDSD